MAVSAHMNSRSTVPVAAPPDGTGSMAGTDPADGVGVATLAVPSLGTTFYGNAFVYLVVGNRDPSAEGYLLRFAPCPPKDGTGESFFAFEEGDSGDLGNELHHSICIDWNETEPVFKENGGGTAFIQKNSRLFHIDPGGATTLAGGLVNCLGEAGGGPLVAEAEYWFQTAAARHSEPVESGEDAVPAMLSEWSEPFRLTLRDPSFDFEAHAVSPGTILVTLPEIMGAYFSVQRRPRSGGEWTDVAVRTDSRQVRDEGKDGPAGNVLYDYRIRIDAEGLPGGAIRTQWFKRTDEAWLTHTHPYSVDAMEFASSGIYDGSGLEIERPDPVCMEIPMAFNGRNGEYSDMKPPVFQRGATPTFLARIANREYDPDGSGNPVVVSREDVDFLRYTVFKLGTAYGSATRVIEGHTEVDVPLDGGAGEAGGNFSFWMQERLVTEDKAWLAGKDEIGYNFKFTPDSTEHLAFPETGRYIVRFELHMKPGCGNPICWSREIEIE